VKIENIVLSGKFWVAFIAFFVCVNLFSEDSFYICTGDYSEVYHSNEYCKGLEPCRAEIKIINKEEVIELNRRLCRICKPLDVYESD